MAQQYYEYNNYKEEHVQEQKKLPKGACHSYIIVFQSIFHIIFNVSPSQPSYTHSPAALQMVSQTNFMENNCEASFCVCFFFLTVECCLR